MPEDSVKDYIESLKTRKMPIGWKKPEGKPPVSETGTKPGRFESEEIDPFKEQYKKVTQKNIMTKPAGPSMKVSTGPSTMKGPSSVKPLPVAPSGQYKKLKMQKPGDVREIHTAYEDEDMLVYPAEFKMGMKEELEHSDVIGGDKEALKKIVLAHLKENPKYYTKLGTIMKADIKKESVQTYHPPMHLLPKPGEISPEGKIYSTKTRGPAAIMKEQQKNLPPLKAEETITELKKPKPYDTKPFVEELPKPKGPILKPYKEPKSLIEKIFGKKAKEESYKEFTSRPEVKKEIMKQKIQERTPSTPYKITPPYKPKWQKMKEGIAEEANDELKAEEETQLKWTPKQPKPKPVETLKQSPKDEIESFLHLHRAEETINAPLFERKPGPLPTEKDWGEFNKYSQKISDKLKTKQQAEEEDVKLDYSRAKPYRLSPGAITESRKILKQERESHPPEKTMEEHRINLPPKKAEEEIKEWTIDSLAKKDKRQKMGDTESKYKPELDAPPLTKKNIRQNFQHQHGASQIIDDFLAEEEKKPGFNPYSKSDLGKQGTVTRLVTDRKPMHRPFKPTQAVAPRSEIHPTSKKPKEKFTPAVPKAAPVMSEKTKGLRNLMIKHLQKTEGPSRIGKIPMIKHDIDIEDKPLDVKKTTPLKYQGEEKSIISKIAERLDPTRREERVTTEKIWDDPEPVKPSKLKTFKDGLKKAEEELYAEETPQIQKPKVDFPQSPKESALSLPKGTSGYILPKGKTLEEWASEVVSGFRAEERNVLEKKINAPNWLVHDIRKNKHDYKQPHWTKTPERLMDKQQKNLPPLKAEEEPDGSTNDKLNELYSFMTWLLMQQNPQGRSYAQLKAQYSIEKFAEEQQEQSTSDKLGEMEKPARFVAEPPIEEKPIRFKAPDERIKD